ncbi:MAG TPA: hypothetical protein PLS69_03650, partial [Terricaulis sp.]|nr:hypothetical protein [Terricaulis sp.]
MRLWTLFCACLFFIAPSVVLAQSRFSDDTLRAWEADANGRSCETQTFGFLGIPRATFAYPERALTDRVSGDVLLIFDTQYTDGVLSVVNPRVFASEPEGSFDGVARELASQFQFPAAMRDCEGLRAWLRFRVNNANAAGEMRGFVAGAEATPALT